MADATLRPVDRRSWVREMRLVVFCNDSRLLRDVALSWIVELAMVHPYCCSSGETGIPPRNHLEQPVCQTLFFLIYTNKIND